MLASIALFSACLLLTTAAGLQGINFQDRSGNLVIRNGKSFRLTFDDADGESRGFKGIGKPLILDWKDQMLHVEAGAMEGSVKSVSQGKSKLTSATLTGGVSMVRKSKSAAQGDALQELAVTSDSANYVGAEEKWTMTGSVVLKRKDPSAGQDFTLRGAIATAHLYPPGSSAASRGLGIKAGTVTGPVTFTMHAMRKAKSGADPTKFLNKLFTTEGKCDRLEFDNEKGELVMIGNVFMSGDDPALFGEISNVNRAVLHLDDAGRVKSIEMDGEPGITKIKNKPPFRSAALGAGSR